MRNFTAKSLSKLSSNHLSETARIVLSFICIFILSEPADEVLYDDARDKGRYIGCRNNKWTDQTRVCRLNVTFQCDGTSQCGECFH